MIGINFEDHKFAIKVFLLVGLLIHSAIESFAADVHYLNTGVFFLFYGLLFLLALPVIKEMYNTFLDNLFLNLLILWAVVSIFWTTNLLETLLALVSLLGMYLFAFYLVEKFKIEEIWELLIYFFLISILINAYVLYFFPELSIHHEPGHNGKWRGVFWHKNLFAHLYSFSIIVFSLALYFKTYVSKWLLSLALVASFWFVYKSGSTTAWLVSMIYLILFMTKWLQTRFHIKWRWIILFFVISTIIVALNANLLLMQLFGKDTSFHGRIDLWLQVWELIQQNLLSGNGYYGFWYNAEHSFDGLKGNIFYGLRAAHNGFLDVLVFLGVIGMFFFALMLGKALFLSAKLYFSDEMTLHSVFPFVFLVSFSVVNLMESYFLVKMRILTVVFLYVVIYLNLGRAGARGKLKATR